MADLLPFLHGVDPNMERLRGAFVQRGQDPNGLEDAQHVHNAWVEVHYPLASDELLRQSLQTVGFRAVRMSKLYEFIDAITADVAYRHCDPSLQRLSLVTAGHYDSKRLRPITISSDISMRSYVVLTGKSSLEIRTDTYQVDSDGVEQLCDVCHTVMVALDKDTGKPVQIRSLTLGEDDGGGLGEKRTELVQELRAKRFAQQKAAPTLVGESPNEDEMQLVHALTQECQEAPSHAGHARMSDWMFTNSVMIYPERRNMHGKLFGGFVASTAYDLAYYSARAFCGGTLPFALGFDQMRFFAPVSIGDQVHFTARVVFTEGKILRVWVDIEQLDSTRIKGKAAPVKGSTLTNQMEFIFAHPSEDVRKIVPEDYNEVLQYLTAQRWQQSTGPTDQHITNYNSFMSLGK